MEYMDRNRTEPKGLKLRPQGGKGDRCRLNRLASVFSTMATTEEQNQLLPSTGERKQAEQGDRELLCRKLATLVKARLKDAFAELGTAKPGLDDSTILPVNSMINSIETRFLNLEGLKYDTSVLVTRSYLQAWRKDHEEKMATTPEQVGPSKKKVKSYHHTGAASSSASGGASRSA